jgi:hypothetical protein
MPIANKDNIVQMQDSYKHAYYAGLVCYVVMAVLSILFYKERTLFTDIAYHVFNIMRTNSFAIQNMRFNAAATQVFPLLAFRVGLPLHFILLLYSLGFILFYAVCYMVCGHVLKQYRFALLLLLLNILFVSDTFYWIQSELPQGLALMVLLFAFLCNRNVYRHGAAFYIVLVLGTVTVAFSHPLLIFPFFFVVFFLVLVNDKPVSNKLLLIVSCLFILSIVIKQLVFPSAYERNSSLGAKQLITIFPHYGLHIYANRHFLYRCLTHYYWLPIIMVTNIGVYISARQWPRLLLFMGASAGYLLLVNVSHPDAASTDFYMENLYLLLAIFTGLPFIWDVLPVLQLKKLAVIVVLAIAITGCVRIYLSHSLYTRRLNWERAFLKVNQNKKLVIYEPRVPMDTLMMTWGTAYEFLMLSEIEDHKSASIIVINNIPQYDWAFGQTSSLIVLGDVYRYAQLPQKYFQFTDTVTKYTLVK